MKKKLVSFLALVCLGAAPVFAEAGKFSVAAHADANLPFGHLAKRYNAGLGFGVSPHYRIMKMLELFVDTNFAVFPRDFSHYGSGYTASGGSYKIFSVIPGAKAKLPVGDKIKIFGLAGFGVFIQSISDLNISGPGYWSHTTWTGTEWNAGLVLGGGLEIALTKALSLVPEIRVTFVFMGADGYLDNLNYFTVRFGGKYSLW